MIAIKTFNKMPSRCCQCICCDIVDDLSICLADEPSYREVNPNAKPYWCPLVEVEE